MEYIQQMAFACARHFTTRMGRCIPKHRSHVGRVTQGFSKPIHKQQHFSCTVAIACAVTLVWRTSFLAMLSEHPPAASVVVYRAPGASFKSSDFCKLLCLLLRLAMIGMKMFKTVAPPPPPQEPAPASQHARMVRRQHPVHHPPDW